MIHRNQTVICSCRTFFRALLAYVFPPRCPVCDAVPPAGRTVCGTCAGKLRRPGETVCMCCGKPISGGGREYCANCTNKRHKFRQGKAVFVYEGECRQSLYRYKYLGRREYALFYAGEAVKLHRDWILRHGVEVLIPVPMYAAKQRRRGYNQAEVFARRLGEELKIPVDTGLVERVRDTKPQKELSLAARKHNLKKAFQLRKNIVKYNKVLLVDDIYTTGSTMDEVSEILLSAGVKEVYFMCVGIGA